MSERIVLSVRLELLSDAVFGSGLSIPGGEDIAVCLDASGRPYLRGSTLKGLLRESVENLLCWTGGSADTLDELFGISGRNGGESARRLRFTDLTLCGLMGDGVLVTRAFTAVENGTVKPRTLRMAQAVAAGRSFEGELFCAAEDRALLTDALALIKWAGTMRSRGPGRVRVSAEERAALPGLSRVDNAKCLRYHLRTDAPVLLTDLSKSGGDSFASRGFIPGSAVRGMVISELASRDPAWFESRKAALLSDATRFLDAVPARAELPALPSICGFYERKDGSGFCSVLTTDDLGDRKRAGLGSFCAIDAQELLFWNAKSESSVRINRGSRDIFRTDCLAAGEELEGYVLLDDETLSGPVSECLSGEIWLGADRDAGCGKCTVTLCRAEEEPAWLSHYGLRAQDSGETLYMLALSPLAMRDETGEVCGLDEGALAAALGVDEACVGRCATTLSSFGGFNRTWGCRVPELTAYDRGSVFTIKCSCAPAPERLRAVEREGLGARRAEGFGQVLFLSPALFEGIASKRRLDAPDASPEGSAAAVRRVSEYRWVMARADTVQRGRLSPSQAGSIQSLCQKAIARGGDTQELRAFLNKNLRDCGTAHGRRFRKISELILTLLDTPLTQTLELDCPDSDADKLRLLSMLFDFSRKNRKEGD